MILFLPFLAIIPYFIALLCVLICRSDEIKGQLIPLRIIIIFYSLPQYIISGVITFAALTQLLGLHPIFSVVILLPVIISQLYISYRLIDIFNFIRQKINKHLH